jgi:hypothetical protein
LPSAAEEVAGVAEDRLRPPLPADDEADAADEPNQGENQASRYVLAGDAERQQAKIKRPRHDDHRHRKAVDDAPHPELIPSSRAFG